MDAPLASAPQAGVPGDQGAFVTALFAMPVKWALLPKAFNAIVVKRNYRYREATILHFFGSEDEQRGTILEHLLSRLRDTAESMKVRTANVYRKVIPGGRRMSRGSCGDPAITCARGS
jgi:hypothetical protein